MFATYLPFEWIVAIRFLKEGRMQTLFIVTGVAIGVGVIVFMSALLAGLQTNFMRRVLNAQAHIQLLQPQQTTRLLRGAGSADRLALEAASVQAPMQQKRAIDQWQSIVAQVRLMRDVREVSPVASGSILLLRGSASRAVTVSGIEPQSYFRIVDFSDKLVRGTLRLGSADMLIGTDLAIDLGVDIGEKLHVTSADGASSTLIVVGIFDLGSKGVNQRNTFTTLRTAQNLLAMPGGVTSIEVTVQDIYAAETMAQRIAATTGVQADSWIKNSAQFFAAISAQTTANTAIRFLVGLSVAFGVASVLVVSVVQKSREIGILRAMGITRGQILRIFLLQGGLLGLGGAVVGSLLGSLGMVVWQQVQRNPDGTVMFAVSLEPLMFATALLLATVTGLLASFAPAMRAARLDPVVAIRG